MARMLSADDLLAGAATVHKVEIPAALLNGGAANGDGAIAGEVGLRALTLKDIQRVTQAAKESRVLTSVLLVQQALVEPKLTVEQGGALPAGIARFLLDHVNSASGLDLADDDIEEAIKAPLARACFALSKEFGWTPAECAELTIGQALLYLEMIARGEHPEEGKA
ncbi:MAG: hypothetical protein ACRED5_05400 [Propylenella sp.]